MKILTHNQLIKCIGCSPAASQVWLPAINLAMSLYGINRNSKRIAAFLAQVGHETLSLQRTSENLNYSANRLLTVWPKRFNQYSAAVYARRPEDIANHVYANRHGNGDENSGDGWRYRGRGLFHITFRNNYSTVGGALGLDLVSDPDLLLEPDNAAKSAAHYWSTKNLNVLADKGDIDTISRIINGGTNGLEDRRRRYNKALSVLMAV